MVAGYRGVVYKNIILVRYPFEQVAKAFRRVELYWVGVRGSARDSKCGTGYICYSAGA